jgi:hypothetical protein
MPALETNELDLLSATCSRLLLAVADIVPKRMSPKELLLLQQDGGWSLQSCSSHQIH